MFNYLFLLIYISYMVDEEIESINTLRHRMCETVNSSLRTTIT